MNLNERIDLMVRLGDYMKASDGELFEVINQAYEKNRWFTPEFVLLALKNISTQFLNEEKLRNWVNFYHVDDNISPKNIGIVMAGNIPLVGFQDFLCVFISGHSQIIKLSEKDEVLMKHVLKKLIKWNVGVSSMVKTMERLKGCDAYIATGSNNSSRYFNYYFGKYPSIIRSNKTSVAILTGEESRQDLWALATDVYTYFGLGCRNVTKVFAPQEYDFVPLLEEFKRFNYLSDHTKYRNNYDYSLALLIMNNKFYMTNGSIILTENDNIFSSVSELHYSFYSDIHVLKEGLEALPSVQGIVGNGFVPFGESQKPGLFNYADGVDVMEFLLTL